MVALKVGSRAVCWVGMTAVPLAEPKAGSKAVHSALRTAVLLAVRKADL